VSGPGGEIIREVEEEEEEEEERRGAESGGANPPTTARGTIRGDEGEREATGREEERERSWKRAGLPRRRGRPMLVECGLGSPYRWAALIMN